MLKRIILAITGVGLSATSASYVYWCYREWQVAFPQRKKRSEPGCPSYGPRPAVVSTRPIAAIEESAAQGPKLGAVKKDDRASSIPSLMKNANKRNTALDMDHIYLPFRDYFWSMLFVAPNAFALTLYGVMRLLWRRTLHKCGVIKPLPHNPRRLVSKLVLETYRAMHFEKQEVVNGTRVGLFLWHDVAMLDGHQLKIYKEWRIEIDLAEKVMRSAKLDGRDLSPEETIVLLAFNAIAHDHVKIHALGNWAANVEQDDDPFLRRMSVISIIYNYFGMSRFPKIVQLWHRLGFLSDDFKDLEKVFAHGVRTGVPYHAHVGQLAWCSELVAFTVKMRIEFLRKFAAMPDVFPSVVDGESLFASTIVHSLDHQCFEWHMQDPLWLDVDNICDEFKPMAELTRFVLVGFTSALPGLLIGTRYKHAKHPFFRDMYQMAVSLNKRFADQMDTCIVR